MPKDELDLSLSTSFLPWPDYDSDDEATTIEKLERKTTAIRTTTDYNQIESAAAIAASVLNHERVKDEPRQKVVDKALKLYEAGMTAN